MDQGGVKLVKPQRRIRASSRYIWSADPDNSLDRRLGQLVGPPTRTTRWWTTRTTRWWTTHLVRRPGRLVGGRPGQLVGGRPGLEEDDSLVYNRENCPERTRV